MARTPTPTRGSTVLLQPTAAPVDTYVNPGPSRLQEFAESLRPLDRELDSFLQERTKKALEQDAIRGEAAFHTNNGVGFAEGVRSGRIPAQYSQTFMRAYKNAEGQAAGVRLQSAYQSAWESWGGRNEDDPDGTKFNEFFTGFVQSNLGTDDPDVLAGLLPAVRSLGSSAAQQQTTYTSDRVYSGSLTAHLSGINSILDDADAEGLASGNGTNYDASGSAIEAQRNAFIQSGGKAEDFDQGAMNAIAGKAIELRDPQLLAFFDRTVPGETYTYGDTPYGQKLKQSTVESLETMARAEVVAGNSREEAERKVRLAAAQRAAIGSLVAGEAVPEEILVAGEREDPEFRTKIGQWSADLDKGLRNPALVRDVMGRIMGGDMNALVEAAPNITSSDDLQQLNTFLNGYEQSRGRIDEAMGSTSVRNILDAIDQRTRAINPMTFEPISGMSNDGLEAQHDFRTMYQEWIVANPNATFAEREENAQRIGQIVLKGITEGDGFSEGGSYTPQPEAAQYGNAQRDPQPVQEGRAPQAPSDATGTPEEQDAAWFNGLGQEDRAAINVLAARKGQPVSDVIRQLRSRTAPAAAEGMENVSPISYDPAWRDTEASGDDRPEFTSEMATQFLQAALSAPDGDAPAGWSGGGGGEAGALLGLIRQHEAAGNYNAVYGNARSTRDLSQMSVDQILGQQQAARRRGVASTAIGAYQFIYKTLRGLKSEMGLTGQERFTPELQDRMAVQLLRRRGWDAYKGGRISQSEFGLRLSMEWASLPNPRTGRSYYDGDGLNASSVRTREVYRAMGFTGGPDVRPQTVSFSPQAPRRTAADIQQTYTNIPEAELGQFLQWNPDPVGNHEANLQSIDTSLASVVRRAQELSGVPIVIGSGRRDAALQAKAVEWGWSKTRDSDHLHGGAVDLWGLDGAGGVTFDPETQAEIVRAMKQAAKELGVELDVGADWKSFKDNPHFAIRGRTA